MTITVCISIPTNEGHNRKNPRVGEEKTKREKKSMNKFY